ncbi:MAG: PA0069 family radical SAM protein [Rhodothalassiaceae bacterium]
MTESLHPLKSATWRPPSARRGRAAASNPDGRFERLARAPVEDGWQTAEQYLSNPRTTVTAEAARTVITRNQSPDIPFDRSINPYRGCEHGCVYCYARPAHAVMGLSPGLDFETQLFAKREAADKLRRELAKPGYEVRPIALGTNTDPYQPVEKRWRITRSILQVLAECRHPVTIVTKSHMVVRDLDILAPMAAQGLAKVALSLTTLDRTLARAMEPRASTPPRRLDALRILSDAGVPAGVMTAPIIPGLNDHEIESLLAAAARAGACEAGWVMVRLPHEVKQLFAEWLEETRPQAARRILHLIRQVRSGRDNDPAFHSRMRGEGPYADLIAKRFRLAAERLGLQARTPPLRTDLFVPPRLDGQLDLFASS